MAEEVKYYAIVGMGRTREDPNNVARRRFTAQGRVDESLRRDMTWGFTSAITDWERGEGREIVEISEEEANRIIERLRAKWSAGE